MTRWEKERCGWRRIGAVGEGAIQQEKERCSGGRSGMVEGVAWRSSAVKGGAM